MIRLPDTTLSRETLSALSSYQAEIVGTYLEMVARAKEIWPSRKQNKPFTEVLDKLVEMCSGAKRCCYCEDSMADEIEHIAPKSLYPERTFVWENYLYACGTCNGPKNNQWAIFAALDGSVKHLKHPDSGPLNPMEVGEPLLFNPRWERPEEWLMLSLNPNAKRLDFVPAVDDESSVAYIRAEYTIAVLGLNSRSKLGEARQEAYGNYRARLAEIHLRLSSGESLKDQETKVSELKRAAHPTVWREIIRYRKNGWLKRVDAEFDGYFDAVPAAEDW